MMNRRMFTATFKLFGTLKETELLKKKVKSLSHEMSVYQIDIQEECGVWEEEWR